MATNGEWLDYLAQNAPDELAAWFDAEHVENQERALDGDTDAQNADSRERLEADVREWIDIATYKKFTPERMLEVMLHWLDRQAAITERKCRKPNWDYCETCETLAELTAERDELKGQVFTLKCECEDLENELHKLTAEREHYREKFGKCLDYADAIHALMDDEGIA